MELNWSPLSENVYLFGGDGLRVTDPKLKNDLSKKKTNKKDTKAPV